MSLTGKRILVVDDIADVRMRCRKTLETFGLTALEAASVHEALASASRDEPALIILDLQMAGKSGFDFLTARSQSLSLSAIPVIVMSGLNDKVSVQKAVKLGANDFIVKPVNATILLQRIRKHLSGHNFREYTFSDQEGPTVELQADARITRFECTSFNIESAIQIKPGTLITFRGGLPKQLQLENATFVAVSKPGPLTMRRLYHTEIEVIGLSRPLNKGDSKT